MDDDKELIWVGSSKQDLSAFPDDVKLVMGFALRVAQQGGKHARAKPLKGYKGAGMLEIVDDFDGDTYRSRRSRRRASRRARPIWIGSTPGSSEPKKCTPNG